MQQECVTVMMMRLEEQTGEWNECERRLHMEEQRDEQINEERFFDSV